MVSLVLLFLPIVLQGCLVVRETLITTTPKPVSNQCDCPYVLMDSTNAQELIGHRKDIYDNITLYAITKAGASIVISNCGLAVGCPSGYERIVIGEHHWQPLGAGSYCNKEDKKWRMKPSASEEHISAYAYVTCVLFITLTTPLPTTPTPITKCSCPVELVDSTNAAEYISHYPIYYKSLIKYPLAMPIPTVSIGSGPGMCSLVTTCPVGYTRIVITQEGWHELPDYELYCQNRQWAVNNNVTKYIFLTCVDYNIPTPAPTPRSCNCADPTLLSSVGNSSYQLVNWKISAVMIEETDPCFIHMHCRDEAIMQLWINGEYYMEEISTGMCNYETNNWEIPAPQIWIPTKLFNYSCVEPIPFWESCGCPAELLDTANAPKFIGQHDFYLGNLSRYDLVKPSAVMLPDCILQFDCPGDMSRVMIEDNQWHVIDAMEGICKQGGDTKQWDIRIGTETSIAPWNVYLTCVNFNVLAPTTTTREPPITSSPVRTNQCGCKWDLMDVSNAKYYLSRYDIYTTTLYKWDLVLPEPEEDGCKITWKCPGDLKVVIFEETRGFQALNPISICDSATRQWTVTSDDASAGQTPYVFATCVNYDEPLTSLPPPPTCHCPFSIPLGTFLGPGNDYPSTNWDIQTYISEDRCSWTVRCRDPAGEIISSDGHDKNWFTWAKEIYPTCNPETNSWSVMPEGGMQATNYSVLSLKCVVQQLPESTMVPATTTTKPVSNQCDCPYVLMDSTNAQELIGHRKDIYDNITLYDITTAIVDIIDCGLFVECPDGYERTVIGEDHWQPLGAGTDCNKNDKMWSMKPSESEEHISAYAYVTCVQFKPQLDQCACEISLLQQSNINDHQLPIDYQDLFDHPLATPIPKATPTSEPGSCMLSFTCPNDYTKVLIAEDMGYKQRLSPISCSNNQWQSAAGPFFNSPSVMIACVDYSTWTPTVPKSRCGCRYKSINSENAQYFVSHYDLYQDKVSKYQMFDAKPIGAQTTDCIVYWECSSPGLRKVVFEQTRAYETVGPDTECYKFGETDYEWSIIPTDGPDKMSPYIFVTCVNYSAPIISEPKCKGCVKSLLFENSFEGYTLTNWDVQVDISEDRCSWNVHCRGDHKQATANIGSDVSQQLLANSWTGICSPEDNKWNLTSDDNRRFNQLDQFLFNCVTETDKWE